MMFRMAGSNSGVSRYYYSTDRCHTWQGPYTVPDFGWQGIFARTDYIIDGKHEMMAFMTAAEDQGGEGWPFAARTTNGGKTWEFVGWIGEQPAPDDYAIMPSTLRIDANALFSVIRRRGTLDGKRQWWMESFVSPDNGKSWYMTKEPWVNNAGNPPHMIALKDGRWGENHGFRSCQARVEVKAMDTATEAVAAADSRHASAAELGEFIAGKKALRLAGAELGLAVAGQLANYWQERSTSGQTP